MKYNFELIRFSKSGKYKASFFCEHCKCKNLYVGACLYTANLSYDPLKNIKEACKEFVDNINNQQFDMFDNKIAGKSLKSSLCNCSANVVSLKVKKARQREVIIPGQIVPFKKMK